jgi:hypothetical protein
MKLSALVLLAQLTCSDLSAGNPTLYRPLPGGGVECLDWDEKSCSYVPRPCRPGEVSPLCKFVSWACPKPTVERQTAQKAKMMR